MKRIINGKRYDTETAILVGESCSSDGVNDFRYWEESLYKTPKSGVFFIVGIGGPMTQWSKAVGNGRVGGEGLRPLDYNEALEWAERYLPTKTIEEHFSEVLQDA